MFLGIIAGTWDWVYGKPLDPDPRVNWGALSRVSMLVQKPRMLIKVEILVKSVKKVYKNNMSRWLNINIDEISRNKG